MVGVGFVGLSVVTATSDQSAWDRSLSKVSKYMAYNVKVFDMGWPAAAAVAYNTAVGALIIPICLGVNFLMLITRPHVL